jgi:hypothetical protein
MGQNFSLSKLAIAALLFFPSVMLAQTPAERAKPAAKTIPDLSGVWDNSQLEGRAEAGPAEGPQGGFIGPGGIPTFGFSTEEPPMLPWAAEKYQSARTGLARGPLDKGNDKLNPILSCFPPGPTRMYTILPPWEIRQLPDVVLLLFESDHWVRRVYLDGRGHPANYPITWMGHSIGWYEGDTLVVDTVGTHDQTWIDGFGHPHTEALHIVERFHLLDHDSLQIDLTFDDPKAYARPWTGKKIFKRAPPGFELLESVICEDWLQMGKHH